VVQFCSAVILQHFCVSVFSSKVEVSMLLSKVSPICCFCRKQTYVATKLCLEVGYMFVNQVSFESFYFFWFYCYKCCFIVNESDNICCKMRTCWCCFYFIALFLLLFHCIVVSIDVAIPKWIHDWMFQYWQKLHSL